MAKPTILLFDIDGTLVAASGAGRRAMERAVHEHIGREDACRFGFDGMTDRAIVRRSLASDGGASVADERIDAVLDTYVARLAEELASPKDAYQVFRGVRESLAGMRGRRGFAVGLGTGNIRRGAALKLGCVGLDGAFAFGGFGCDHEERPQILATGACRGASLLGFNVAECRVVVIGDTPRDVAGARAIGAECLGVATGRYSVDQLLAAGATLAVSDLTDPRALNAMLGDGQ